MIDHITKAIMTPAFRQMAGDNSETLAASCAHAVVAELSIQRLEFSYNVRSPHDRPSLSPYAETATNEVMRREAKVAIALQLEPLILVEPMRFAGPAERASLWIIRNQGADR